MLNDWLRQAARKYNQQSLLNKDGYRALLLMPLDTLEIIIDWTFKSLPDEILIGLDSDKNKKNPRKVEQKYMGYDFQDGLFAGQGYLLGKPHLVNRGDSFSVHHVPEEWNDGLFSKERGVRGGRFTHWLHTHPNAPAIPSSADADAAQWTEGCDMILGIKYSPEGILPWFEDIDGVRRQLNPMGQNEETGNNKKYIGIAKTGHMIHDLELISFHKRGFAVNIILTDNIGNPI